MITRVDQLQVGQHAGAADLEHAATRIAELVHRSETFFDAHADRIAVCAGAMADRFFSGATLLVFGLGAHTTDAQHNSVEFVHPALPGCRALPALALSNDVATVTGLMHRDGGAMYAHQLRLLGRRGDIALAFAHAPLDAAIEQGLRQASALGLLTVALTAGAEPHAGLADHVFHADDPDPLTAHELHLATYHMLWELVHVVLNHRGIGAER